MKKRIPLWLPVLIVGPFLALVIVWSDRRSAQKAIQESEEAFARSSERLRASEVKVVPVAQGDQVDHASIQDVDVQSPRRSVRTREGDELVATALNLNGLLCAEVVDIRPLRVKGALEVTCIAYRNGSGRKTYVLDTSNGSAWEQ